MRIIKGMTGLLLALSMLSINTALAATLESFSPQGQVKSVRQVVARFSEPMVSFGDPRQDAPFDIRCEAKGRSRWVDARNWVHDFEADLPAGLECAFTLRAGLKTAAGAPVTPTSHRFSTGGPAVVVSWPEEGSESVDESQIFLLGLDAAADAASVKANASCRLVGVGERIALEIIEGKEREAIIAEQAARAGHVFQVLTKRGQSGLLAVKDRRLQDAPIMAARCARKLPPGARIDIVWGVGIRTASGVATNEAQTLSYQVREDFTAEQSCMRVKPDAGCVPISPISLRFTAPVQRELAEDVVLRTSDGRKIRAKIDAKEQSVQSLYFAGPFPARSTATLELPRGFKDDAGRPLANHGAFPLKINIDEDPPLIKFGSHFGILESQAQPMLPVSVRNVESTLKAWSLAPLTPTQSAAAASKGAGKGSVARVRDDDAAIADWLRRVLQPPHHRGSTREGEVSIFGKSSGTESPTALELPATRSDRQLELIGIPLPKPGFYVVEFASQRLGNALHGEDKPYYAYSSALVTNLSLHFKRGREDSLVWVTRLDNAGPVANAQVRVNDCRGNSLWQGQTDAKGMAKVDVELPRTWDYERCPHAGDALLVTARKDGELGFMLSSWSEGISPWEFNLGGGGSEDPVSAHTVLDRPLFRAGEKVSMKHFVRLRTGKGFALMKDLQPGDKIEIYHEGSEQTFEVPARWASTGNGLSEWEIPKEAKLGSYAIRIRVDGEQRQTGTFRVEQYRLPLMRAVLKPPAPVINATALDVDAQLSYMAGGAAAGAPVKFRSRLVRWQMLYPAYEDFNFGGKAPREGIEAVEPYSWDPEGEEAANPETAPVAGYPVKTVNQSLDGDGGARVRFDGLPKGDEARALEVEMEYADPNGQILTSATRALVLPSALVLGMKQQGYFATEERLAFQVLALDVAGKPQAGRKITVDAYQRKTYAYRKRLLGGFYAYEQTAEVKRLGVACKGQTDARGLLVCDGEAPGTGELVLVARGEDAAGNDATASTSIYVADRDSWYGAGASDRIDILADKRSYEPGDPARFEVRMPFREATALITVEREGVLSATVQHITAKSPFVDVPILDNYGPNAYVSVAVVRGRIDPEAPGPFAWLKRMVYRVGLMLGLVKDMPREVIDTHPTALVDLTKPAFKLGMAQMRVGWKAYTLKVRVESDKQAYRVRDRAAVRVFVTDADGKPASGAEVALAAVDESLLSLAPATSWDLLDAMMQRRAIEVHTSTGQLQVIGKRHFGKKAAPPGGGGGAANARELFDTLLLWQGVVKLDDQGSARIEVPLNDSLTSFRIEAIASQGAAKFGSGHALIRSTQEVMLFSGIPPYVREGDHFTAQVTVRNGGERELTLDVSAQPGAAAAATQRVTLKPGAGSTLDFPTTAPLDVSSIVWNLSAVEVGGSETAARDALKITQKVGWAYPLRVYQQTLEQLDASKPWSFPVALPAGAVPGRGGTDVRLTRSLGGDVGAIREWMSRYPFTCLEQRASVSVAMEDEEAWNRVMNSLPAHLDGDGLARYFAMDWLQGDDSLTAYLLSVAHQADYDIPEAARERMLRGLENFVAGRVIRYGSVPRPDLVLRKLAAIDALSRYGRAKPAMLESMEIAPNLWPSSGVIDWLSILGRMEDIPRREQRLGEARQVLRSRMMFSGTALTWSTEKTDYLWWLMVSPDLNAVRALLVLADDASFAPDMPRMARGALSRQYKGRWNTTLANAWGVLALRSFQKRFERDPVDGVTQVQLGDAVQKLNWSDAKSFVTNDPTLGTPPGAGLEAHFPWPTPATTATPFSLQHQGGGKPWAFVTARASLPLDKPLFAGYSIKRTVTAVEQKKSGVWSRGDVWRVKLEIEAQSDMTWVVVNDPVPAGSTILGSGLGGDSSQLTSGEKQTGWQRPAFEERAFDGFRAYYAYVPKGRFSIEYSLRLNSIGKFEQPASRVEAMYAPEIFGELPVAKVEIVAP